MFHKFNGNNSYTCIVFILNNIIITVDVLLGGEISGSTLHENKVNFLGQLNRHNVELLDPLSELDSLHRVKSVF